MISLPPAVLTVLLPCSHIFFRSKVWSKALLLLSGALLCRGGITVCSVLRTLGMKGEERFDKYHRVLSRDKWDLLKGAKTLRNMLIGNDNEPVVIAIDEHIERRCGKKIEAKGCYRDVVRSSKGFIVRCFGIKWITVMVLKKLPWATRCFALPFLTILSPSKSYNDKNAKSHKTTIDWAIQIMMSIRRWLPGRKIILTGDGGFANASLAWACLKHNVSLVTRLRLDARLFDFAPRKYGVGRPAKKGQRLLSPKVMLQQQGLEWIKAQVQWYGGVKEMEYVTLTCLWHIVGYDPVPVRLVLLRDPGGKYQSVPLISTSANLNAVHIIEVFVNRWNQEVTHREVREYLGVETQRQWSTLAIARTTPVLFGLYSLVVLIADALNTLSPLQADEAAWYSKESVTFSDALTEVRRKIWTARYFNRSRKNKEPDEIFTQEELRSLIDQLAAAA